MTSKVLSLVPKHLDLYCQEYLLKRLHLLLVLAHQVLVNLALNISKMLCLLSLYSISKTPFLRLSMLFFLRKLYRDALVKQDLLIMDSALKLWYSSLLNRKDFRVKRKHGLSLPKPKYFLNSLGASHQVPMLLLDIILAWFLFLLLSQGID